MQSPTTDMERNGAMWKEAICLPGQVIGLRWREEHWGNTGKLSMTQKERKR